MRHYLFAMIAALTMAPAIASAQPGPAQAAPAQAAPATTCSRPYTTAKTTIDTLMGDPAALEIFKKDLPDVAGNDQIRMAGAMTMKDIQQYVPDQLTDASLAALDADLAKLPAC